MALFVKQNLGTISVECHTPGASGVWRVPRVPEAGTCLVPGESLVAASEHSRGHHMQTEQESRVSAFLNKVTSERPPQYFHL